MAKKHSWRPLLVVYSLLLLLLWPLIGFTSLFVPSVRRQVAARESLRKTAERLARERAGRKRGVLIFASSAGEYEQARPLIDRLQQDGETLVHVVLFSVSGKEYLEARSETVSASLAPLDTLWAWERLFDAVRPELTFVIRHELWPSFLAVARRFGRLVLIDASRGPREGERPLARLLKGTLLRQFDQIHVVDQEDADCFQSLYGIEPVRLLVSGDTKYDRVRERARASAATAVELKERLAQLSQRPHRLVAGSAWEPDAELLLAARRRFNDATAKWLLIIAPHDVGPNMIAAMETRLTAYGLRYCRWSELETCPDDPDALLIDRIGILAELYATADAAWVGGALHHKVHNVLEPACHGLALAFGPNYKNSREAVRLVESGLAFVTQDSGDFATWWGSVAGLDQSRLRVERVDALCGATDRILASVSSNLRSSDTH